MILPRALYNDAPPEPRSRLENNPTLLFSWWCTAFSLVTILFRICGRYIRNECLFREDKIMALSILPLLARMGFVHVVLIYGTNNVDSKGMTALQIKHHETGAKLVLGARIFYALFIWTAKFTISEFLKRMTERFWKRGYEMVLQGIRVFLVVTFCAVLIATLSECQPFDHYWQVTPDPGPQCRQGYAHLLTMGICDMITDLLLIFFPIPIILWSAMAWKRKLSLVTLFSMSLILIAVTGARIPLVIKHQGRQQYRTVFASAEILAAAIVSNAIILGSFLRDRGVKKEKYKFSSTADSIERNPSLRRPTLQQWGSDEDLVHDMGYRLDPELAQTRSTVARPAPVADIERLSMGGKSPPFGGNNWKFPDRTSNMSQHNDESDLKVSIPEDPHPSPRTTKIMPRGNRVSFFDVGGLLIEEDAETGNDTLPSPTESAVVAQDFAQLRRGSRTFLSDIGGLLYTNRSAHGQRRPSRLSQSTQSDAGSYSMSSPAAQPLQDAGGLLSSDSTTSPQLNPTTSPNRTSPPSTQAATSAATKSPPINQQDSEQPLQDVGGLISPESPKT